MHHHAPTLIISENLIFPYSTTKRKQFQQNPNLVELCVYCRLQNSVNFSLWQSVTIWKCMLIEPNLIGRTQTWFKHYAKAVW